MILAQVLSALGIKVEGVASLDDYIDEWEKLAKISKLLVAQEMEMRKIIAGVVQNPKEGVNTFVLPSKRKMKLTHKITRGIDETQVTIARAEYLLANDRPVEFDDLLKVKHDLVVSAYRKLIAGTPASLAVARMVTSKPSAPTVEIV